MDGIATDVHNNSRYQHSSSHGIEPNYEIRTYSDSQQNPRDPNSIHSRCVTSTSNLPSSYEVPARQVSTFGVEQSSIHRGFDTTTDARASMRLNLNSQTSVPLMSMGMKSGSSISYNATNSLPGSTDYNIIENLTRFPAMSTPSSIPKTLTLSLNKPIPTQNTIHISPNNPIRTLPTITLLQHDFNTMDSGPSNIPIAIPKSDYASGYFNLLRETSDNILNSPSIQFPMDGPNTREYFGHGYQPTKDSFSNNNDMIESPSDPYDNSSGEQRFCNGYGEYGQGHVVTHTERSILPDLKPYPFPDDIKNKADVIYNKMIYRVRRGKIRNQMLFFCVYCAHLELDRDVNPVQLGAQFGLTSGEVQRCDSIFSPLQTGYRPPSTNTSPLRYLPDYCQNMELSEEATSEVMILANNILIKDFSLRQENPQTVAAGLLRYYTFTNGITTDDPQKITKVTGRSNVTIEGMFRRVSAIDNS
ncbi:Transcription initiation factor TFIIB [uncultured virus]|nr:Transcription initiation factor TFIIB [uncultured virus]